MKKNFKKLIRNILFRIIKKNRLLDFLGLNLQGYSKDILNILDESGYANSMKGKIPVNVKGEPIPWYTYPAIEYLSQLNLKEKTVFEWGCGNSSLFFAKNAKEVISIEDNLEWYEKIKAIKPGNLTLHHLTSNDYVKIICRLNRKFDIIIIDANQRIECASIASQYLNEGGLIILDNSDWFKNSAKKLRGNNLIQVDFHGFGPINIYAWTTSFFLSRDFNFEPNNGVQPAYAIGGLTHISD